MALTNLRLAGGRSVDLTHLEVSSTYGGLLEGVPVPSLNNRRLGRLERRLTERYPHMGFHLVPPTRTLPDLIDTGFGGEPEERLPPIECVGIFESAPVLDPRDDAWRMSMLVVVWHQDELTLPFNDAARAQLAAIDWDQHARDCEM